MGSYKISLDTYKEDTLMEFLPGDEKMDAVLIGWDTERWYEPIFNN